MDQKIDSKRSKKTNEREKEQIASSPHQSSQNTHALLHSIYLKHHGHHVREIVPAPLFEEGNAHFDGASRKRSGFSVVCLAVSFFLFHFFITARISLFCFCGRERAARERRDF